MANTSAKDTFCVPAWASVPERLHLNPSDVHVWQTSLTLPHLEITALRDLLSADELERADHFVFDRDRDRFVVSHARLRQILAAYADTSPTALRFAQNDYGKPHLAAPTLYPRLEFNLSHSSDLALYAVVLGRRVGVDVEDAQHARAYLDIAQSVFSTREHVALASLPAEQQRTAFYTAWTRKEAFIKARGEGLTYPLKSFSVSLIPGEPAMLHLSDSTDHGRWMLYALTPMLNSNYIGALVVEEGATCIRHYELH